jgi:drug/metabolite transporter (DMT)-like permease
MSQTKMLVEQNGLQLKKPLPKQEQPKKLNPSGVLFVLLSAIGFGTLALFGKLAFAAGLDPLSTLSWRLGGAAVALWSWLLLKGQWRVPYRSAIAAFLLGAVGYALQSVCFFNALTYASVGVTALMFYTYPAFVALLSWLLIRKPISSWQAKALGIAVFGTILTVDFRSEVASPVGIALGIAAGGSYALYVIFSARLVRQLPPITTAAYMLLGATVSLVGWTTLRQGVMIPDTAGAIAIVSGLAIVSTALPIVCLFAGLKRLEVVPATILSTLEPVIAVAAGILLLGEHLWLGQLLGGACIIASTFMLQVKLKH